jgi:hypothetical protein
MRRLKTATAEFVEGQLVPGLAALIDNLYGDEGPRAYWRSASRKAGASPPSTGGVAQPNLRCSWL